jgi:hypothetical protein
VAPGSSIVIGHLLEPHDRPGLEGRRLRGGLSARRTGLPWCSRPGYPPGARRYVGAVPTRRLIAAALLCGLAILLAFTVQIVVAR